MVAAKAVEEEELKAQKLAEAEEHVAIDATPNETVWMHAR